MDFGSAVKILSGKKSSEQNINETPVTSKVITATVVSKSENGSVRVALDGQVFNEDDSQYIELDTVGGLEEGDTVNILLTGNSGYGLTPFAIGSVGSIDRLSERVTIAQEAGDIALATNQHFWTDTSGAHVTDDTSDTWNAEYAKDNHGQLSNPTDNDPWHNILLNSLGILLRRGLLNLTSISKSAIAFYDGTGNSSDNITASFGGNGAIIGKTSGRHVVVGTDGLSVYNSDGSLAPVNSTFDGKNIDGGSISGSKINFSTFEDGVISGSAIDTSTFKNGTISGSVIDASTFANGVIDGSKIKDSSIVGGKIQGSTLTGIPFAAIVDAEVQVANIADAQIGTATIKQAQVENLSSDYAHIQNGIIDNAKISYADVNGLNANYAHVQNGVIDNAKIGYADVNGLNANYAQIDMANVNNAWIANGLIKDAAIKSEMVESISANQLTAGEIDADEITVRNLQASSLTVQTADGYVYVGEKRIPTKEFIDSLKDELQNEIDGAIETFTVSAVPTLNNTPANEWVVSGDAEATRKLRAKHVGDIAYVVNSSSEQNGYCYRFAYDATAQEFKWVLIKDSDVTAALSRLTTAEGKITGLETFESNTTTWMNETDDGLETIRTNHTNLSGRVDKTVVETKQLWFTKANTTAPNKPTTAVTSTSTAGNAWRVVVPAWNASYPNYYYCLQYKLADGTYAWSDVVRDIAMGESQQQGRKGVADAATADGKAVSAQNTANANIKSSVQLWFTKANATAPDKPNAQVTTNNASTTNAWNLAIPTYNSSYPHYFYCYQQQKGDGTYQWSDVVYDRSVTEAQAKAQAALPSSTFTTFQSTTFKNLVDTVGEQSSTITQLSDSVSSVGNILSGTVANPSNWIVSAPSGASYTKAAYGTAGVKVTFNSVGGFEWLYSQPIAVTSGNKYMVFFDYTVGKTYTTTSGKSGYGLVAYSGANAPSGSYDDGNARFLGKAEFSKTASGDRVLKGSFTFTATSDSIILGLNGGQIADNQTGLSFTIDNLVVGETLSTTSNTVNQVKQTATDNSAHIGNLTTTLGTNADGTSKSEDIVHKYNTLDQTLNATVSRVGTTEAKLQTISNPNLTPYFSHKQADVYNATDNTDGYWVQSSADGSPSYITAWDFEQTTSNGDGWAHLKANNTTNVTLYAHAYIHKDALKLKPSTEYTFLVEWVDVTVSGTVTVFVTTEHGGTNNINDDFFTTTVGTAITAGSGSKYLTATTRASLQSGSDKRIRTHIHIPVNASVDGHIRISLYEGKYDGQYKPYVDQSLSSRVSQAETSIEQNADDIKLKATKTEMFQIAQPNLSPFFQSVPFGVSSDNPYWVSNFSTSAFTALEDGWAHFHRNNTNTSVMNHYVRMLACPSVVDGEKYTFLVEIRNIVTNTATSHYIYTQQSTYTQFWGDSNYDGWDINNANLQEKSYYFSAIPRGVSEHSTSGAHLIYINWQVPAGTEIECDIRISLYEGDYTGPYKPYSGAQLYASQSELKITADGINSTVETLSSYKYCETGYSYSLANIKIYSAEGYIGTWRVSQDYDLRIGDTVYLNVHDATRNCDVYVKGTITAMSSATSITMASHGYEDILPVDTIKSTINQSADSVKIQANHVDIEGAAIFTSGRLSSTSLNNAYDAKGAASSVQENLDSLQVGGRNLLRGTPVSYSKNAYLVYVIYTTIALNELEVGDTITIQLWGASIDANSTGLAVFWGGSSIPLAKEKKPDSSGYVKIAYTVTEANRTHANASNKYIHIYNFVKGHSGASLSIERWKIERGNKGTDWSPAPEDVTAYVDDSVDGIVVGGRNLLKCSKASSGNLTKTLSSNTSYTSLVTEDGYNCYKVTGASTYGFFYGQLKSATDVAVVLDANTTYIYSAWIKVTTTASGVTYLDHRFTSLGHHQVYNTASTASDKSHEDVVAKRVYFPERVNVGEWTYVTEQFTTNSLAGSYFGKYVKYNLGDAYTVYVRDMKLEKGNKATDWTPAPEETVFNTQRIYYRKSSTGAPTEPSTWITTGNNGTNYYNQWTTKVPPIASGTGASVDKYAYLYTCEQRQMVDGTLEHTTILLDENTTVIDGGTIITGSLSANSINASSGTFAAANIPNLDASKITAGNIAAARIKTNVISAINSLTTGQIDAARINVSEISIGQSQVTNLTSDLSAKAAQSDLTTEVNQRKATYGTCSTAAGTALKVVTCANFALTNGARIAVKFTTANTTDAPTLNVNSTASDGTPIWVHNAVASSSNPIKWGANATLTFVYDGSAFVLEDKAPTYTVACSTAATTRAKAATVTGALVINGTSVTLRFSKANTYVSNSVQVNFSATGATNVYVDNAATSTTNTLLWNAGTSLTFVRQGAAWYLTERSDASKTASNYIYASSAGIKIANASPSSATTYQLQTASGTDFVVAGAVRNRINGNGMMLYDGNGTADSNIVANFEANLVELGKGSTDAVIKFCNGMGDISYNADTKFLNLNSLRLSNYAKSNGTDMAASQIAAHFDSSAGTNLANVLSEADSSHARVMVSATYPISGGDPKQASIESYANGTEGYITFYANSFIFSGPGISDGGQAIKAIYAGSTVVNLSNGKWLSLADPTVVAQKLGSGASQGNTVCIAQNGGFESYSGVVTGAMGSDGSARAYIYPNHTGYIRINFILIRFA